MLLDYPFSSATSHGRANGVEKNYANASWDSQPGRLLTVPYPDNDHLSRDQLSGLTIVTSPHDHGWGMVQKGRTVTGQCRSESSMGVDTVTKFARSWLIMA
jgi:hypothetical protein